MIGELFLLAYDLFYGTVYFGFMVGLCFLISMILVDFPCTVIEVITKKKIPEKIQTKIKVAITILLVLYVSPKLSIRDIL